MLVLEKLREYGKTQRIALVGREKSLSFRELEERSNAWAWWLLKTQGEDRSPVVIYGDKECDFLCCILGALKSGRAYVPVDRSVPRDRVERILREICPRVIVDFGGLEGMDPTACLGPKELAEILTQPCDAVPASQWVRPENTAYILFTSGSTGTPKGVAVTAGNLDSFCRGVLPWYPPEEGGVILHQVSYAFDVSGCAVYGGLSRGMTLFTVDHQMSQNYRELFQALKDSGLTFWVSTPSFAELCLRSNVFDRQLLPRLETFLFCGEVLTHTLCDALASRFPSVGILNTYGPTEATVLVTAAEVTEDIRRDSRPIPIGRPIQGTMLRLVDEQGKEITREGQTGELVILGSSVGPGYWKDPRRTQQAFFTDLTTGLRGYRTGDLCTRIGDQYYYQGRRDSQLKLNGFRVELGDIEENLQRLPQVLRAAVLPVTREGKAEYLAAFVLLKQDDGLTPLRRTVEIKKGLAAFLPSYMIPWQIFAVDSFPLNVNGKIDRQALLRRLEEKKP